MTGLDALPSDAKVPLAGGLLGAVGLFLPWFVIFGRPRSALDMVLAGGDLAQHATPELLMLWAAMLGLVALAVVAALYLTVAPVVGRETSPRLALVASTFALVFCLLLLVLGFRMGLGYWATTLGAAGLTVGHVRAQA